MNMFSSRQLHLSDLLRLLPWIPDTHVCDIGFGHGELAIALAEYGFRVTALDVDLQCVERAQQRHKHPNAQWLHQDIRGFRMQRDTYGLILCLNVFPFIPNGERARIIGRLKSALKPGGILIISGLLPEDTWAQEKHARTSNQISSRPTGIFDSEEFKKRFADWDTLWAFEGLAHIGNLDTERAHHVTQRILKKTFPTPSFHPQTQLNPHRTGLRLSHFQTQQLPLQEDLTPHYFLEVPAEAVEDPQWDSHLLHLSQKIPLALHSQRLSLGSACPSPPAFLESLRRLSQRLNVNWIKLALGFRQSEHDALPFLQALLPTEETLETVKSQLRQIRPQLQSHLILEPIPHLIWPPQWEMDEATFLKHIAEEGRCFLSLQLETLLHNAKCFRMTPRDYLNKLPREHVVSLSIDHAETLNQSESQALALYIVEYFPIQILTTTPTVQREAPETFALLQKKWERDTLL